MSKLISYVVGGIFVASFMVCHAATPAAPVASATTNVAAPASECAAKAVSKEGKPLAGAAKSSFIKKCEADSKGAPAASGCAEKAVGKNGKPLAGAAKTSFMKKCETDFSAGK